MDGDDTALMEWQTVTPAPSRASHESGLEAARTSAADSSQMDRLRGVNAVRREGVMDGTSRV